MSVFLTVLGLLSVLWLGLLLHSWFRSRSGGESRQPFNVVTCVVSLMRRSTARKQI